MLAQTMGRNVILPDQESMVNGIGIAYKFLAGKLRSQGVAVADPPFPQSSKYIERLSDRFYIIKKGVFPQKASCRRIYRFDLLRPTFMTLSIPFASREQQ